ncbi:glycylpeptide N-tetradecanoyltransferase [Ceratobasidium sp. 414]|nr:glycylpeptide N-tetradecanoyltransferase [Ceratobasidium sp. 414]
MSTDKITFLLNWHATPYHLPIFLAQAKGYYAAEGIKVALLEPNDPSDVTEIIGSGKVDMGCKAMIHTIAGKARGFPITSIGTLLDEPFTGVIYLEGSGVTEDFTSLRGKRIGYVGEFGKIQIDELTTHYGLKPSDYTAVRCGMNISRAIKEGTIDAGIGLENVQMCELEEWCKAQGRPISDVKMLRIDELAELGCCCFWSFCAAPGARMRARTRPRVSACASRLVGRGRSLGRGGAWGGLRPRPLELDHVHACERRNENFLTTHKKEAAAFMRAVKRAADDMFADPKAAWAAYCEFKPVMNTPLNEKIYERSFTYMSRDSANVPRDWTKVGSSAGTQKVPLLTRLSVPAQVTNYSKRLGIVSDDFNPNMTNEFLSWPLLDEVADPIENQKRIARRQMQIAMNGGVLCGR